MKWTTSLLFVVSMATAMPTDGRNTRAFSLFSVVQFPNDECTTAMSPSMTGICVTAEECTQRTGTPSGNCASGFGVCCFTAVTATGTGETITNNVTYITNAGFPSSVGSVGTVAAASFMFPIQTDASIQQIRLDFQTGVFEQPTAATGACAGDQISVVSSGRSLVGFNTLCGTLTGQHIYIATGGATAGNQLNIVTSTTTFARSWKILVRMIEAGNLGLPEQTGCLQYFTGPTGRIKSFNNVDSTGVQGVNLANLQYSVCIRREKGNFNCVDYRESSSGAGATDSFNLMTTAAASAGQGATMCAAEFVEIPSTTSTSNRFCGSTLNPTAGQTTTAPVRSNAKQFGIKVVSTATTTSGGTGTTSGFDLTYNQVGC